MLEFQDFYLISTYVPNSGMKLERLGYRCSQWDKDLQKKMEELRQTGKGVIWTGDLNVAHKDIDIYDTKNKEKVAGFTPEERESFD